MTWTNTYTWGCSSAVGGTFNTAALNALAGCVKPYSFPNGTNVGSPANPNVVPPNARDNSYNDTAITKIQYTKNFGSTAFLRLYGFTFYSDWFLNGPYSTGFCYFFCPLAPDYELNTHTRGLSARVPGPAQRAEPAQHCRVRTRPLESCATTTVSITSAARAASPTS